MTLATMFTFATNVLCDEKKCEVNSKGYSLSCFLYILMQPIGCMGKGELEVLCLSLVNSEERFATFSD